MTGAVASNQLSIMVLAEGAAEQPTGEQILHGGEVELAVAVGSR
jgi:hypothetical protein